ncbi:MAG: succinate dehydrogenase [Gemmatimonadales bacterium]
MTQASVPLTRRGLGSTMRPDRWWLAPAVVFVVLAGFVVYATWAAFQGDQYRFGPYLSPLYSPELFGSTASWFGPRPGWWPGWLPWSPALLILWAPAGFRLTCYYYRGAYYQAFWADPPACAVGEPRATYRGERSLPLVLQNVHRYFLYLALAFLLILAHDVWQALWFVQPATGATRFGIGVGTLVLAVNVVLLGGYTLGCHSLRHLVGGYLDRLSGAPVRRRTYACVSCLNRQHMRWAWMSLVWVAFSDVYVRLCAMGVWTDLRLL